MEQTMFVGDDPAVIVDAIKDGAHVAATIDTGTTRVNGNAAVPTITTLGTGNYKVSFPGFTPAPVEGDELLVRVNGAVDGDSAWTEAVYKLKVLAQNNTKIETDLNGTPSVNVTQVSGSAPAADNLELAGLAYDTFRGLAGNALPANLPENAGGLVISASGDNGDVDAIFDAIAEIESRLTATRAGYLDNLNGHTPQTGDSFARIGANGASLTALASQTSVTTLQASVDAQAVGVTTRIAVKTAGGFERPESGSSTFKVLIETYAESGELANADSTPTLTVVNQAGTDRSANLSAVSVIATGRYEATYTVDNAHVLEQIIFRGAATIGGTAFSVPFVGYVTDAVSVDFTATDRTALNNLTTAIADIQGSGFATANHSLVAAANVHDEIPKRDDFPANFNATVISALGVVSSNPDPAVVQSAAQSAIQAENVVVTDDMPFDANLVRINNHAIPGTGTQLADGFEFFFNVAVRTKTMEDVGGGSGGTSDWTATEKNQIRHRLQLDGTTSAPAANAPGNLHVNVAQVSGDANAADNLEADYDGTGYNKANSTIGTVTTNTDMRGTDGANTVVPPTAEQNAAQVDIALINSGDGTDLLQAIADKIAADWVAGDASPLAIVSAIVNDANILQLIADAAASRTAAESNQTAIGNLATTTQLNAAVAPLASQATADSLLAIASKLDAMLELDGAVHRFTVNALEQAPQGGGGGGTVDVAALASELVSALAGPIQVVSPFHPVTQSLTLVRNADYVDAAAQGPLEIPVPTTFTVTAGDTVRFGAYLESEDQRLAKAGTVVDKSGTLYAQFQIPSSDFASVVASRAWKYEVQHETSGGHVSPMISDAELYLLESHADA